MSDGLAAAAYAKAARAVEDALDAFDVRAFEIRASDYGASAGNLDNYAEINNAIAAAPAAPVPTKIILPGGDLNIVGGPIAHQRPNLWIAGAGMDDTTLVQDYYGGGLVTAQGAMPATKTLAANRLVGEKTITVTVTGGMAEGQWWKIYSDASFTDVEDLGIVRGEWVRIKSVVGATITLYSPLRDDYLTADNAKMTRATLLPGVRYSDFSIRSTHPDGSQHADQLRVDLCLNPLIDNVRAYDAASTGIGVVNCVGPVVLNPVVFNRADDPSNGLYGYGVAFGKATEDGIVYGIRGRRCRHAFTTGQPESGGAFDAGVPRNFLVVDGVASECTAVAWDTHSCGEGGGFVGLRSRGSNCGFQARARGTSMLDCESAHDGCGLFVRPDAHDFLAEGFRVRDARTAYANVPGSTAGMGAYIIGADNVRLRDFHTLGTDAAGVFIDDGGTVFSGLPLDGLVIEDASFENYGQDPASAFGRAGVYVEDTLPASDGWDLSGIKGRLVTSRDRSIRSGATPPYLVQIEAIGVTGNIEGLRSRDVPTLRCLSPGMRKRNNRRIDQASLEQQARFAGVVAASMDRRGSLSNQAALVNSRILFMPLPIEAGTRLTAANLFSGATAMAGATLVRAYWARYVGGDNMEILAVSDDLSAAAFASDGELPITFPTPTELNDDEVIRLGIHITATTLPTLRGAATNQQIVSTRDRLAALSTATHAAVKAVGNLVPVTGTNFMVYVEAVGQ